LRDTERRVGELDARLAAQARADAVCQRLMTIPGIGPITATALAATIGDATVFSSGRHLAAWPWRARLAVRCARRSDTGQVGTKRYWQDRTGKGSSARSALDERMIRAPCSPSVCEGDGRREDPPVSRLRPVKLSQGSAVSAPSTRKVARLLIGDPDKQTAEERRFVTALLDLSSPIVQAVDLIKSFSTMIKKDWPTNWMTGSARRKRATSKGSPVVCVKTAKPSMPP
jgi:hypothetical protein